MTLENQKHNAVWDWLYNGDNGISDLYFISGIYDGEENPITYTPETAGKDEWLKKYVDGGGIKLYSFMLSQYCPLVSQSGTDANIVTLGIFEKVLEWVDEQNKAKEFPSFPRGCEIQSIETTPAMIAGQDEIGAKLQCVVQLKYYTREV